MYRFFIVILIFVIGCAHQGVNKNSGPDQVTRSLNELRSIQAETTSQQTQLSEELRNLVGRLEELEYKFNSRNTQANIQMPTVPVPEMQPPTTPVVPVMRPPTEPRVPAALTSYDTPPPIVPLQELVKDEQLVRHLDVQISGVFTDALYFVRRGDFRQALSLLDQVLSLAQGKDGHQQALFWQGVSYDGIGSNREALGSYNSVITQYPDTDRARLSLFRLASVFVRMGDAATARITLQKLIAEAPTSNEAEMARKRLQDLK